MQAMDTSSRDESTSASLSNEYPSGNGLRVDVSYDDDDDDDDKSDPELSETLRKHREMIREMKRKYRVSPSFARRDFESQLHFEYSNLSNVFSHKTTIQSPPSGTARNWSSLVGSPDKRRLALLPPSYQKVQSRSSHRLDDNEKTTKKEALWREEGFVEKESQYNDDDFSRLMTEASEPQSKSLQHQSRIPVFDSAEVDGNIYRGESTCDGDSSQDEFFESFEVPRENEEEFREEFFDCISNSQSVEYVEEPSGKNTSSPIIMKYDNTNVVGSHPLAQSLAHNPWEEDDRSVTRSITLVERADDNNQEHNIPSSQSPQSLQHEKEEELVRSESPLIENVTEEECESSVKDDNFVEENQLQKSIAASIDTLSREDDFKDSVQHEFGTQMQQQCDEEAFRTDSSFIENMTEEQCGSKLENEESGKHESQRTIASSFESLSKEDDFKYSVENQLGTQMANHINEEAIRTDSSLTEDVTTKESEECVESVDNASVEGNLSDAVSSFLKARSEDGLEHSVEEELETDLGQYIDDEPVRKEDGLEHSVEDQPATDLGHHVNDEIVRKEDGLEHSVEQELETDLRQHVSDEPVREEDGLDYSVEDQLATNLVNAEPMRKEDGLEHFVEDQLATDLGQHVDEPVREEDGLEHSVEDQLATDLGQHVDEPVREEDGLEHSVEDQLATYHVDEELVREGNGLEHSVEEHSVEDQLATDHIDEEPVREEDGLEHSVEEHSVEDQLATYHVNEEPVREEDGLEHSVEEHSVEDQLATNHVDEEPYSDNATPSSLREENSFQDFVSVDCDEQYLNFLRELRRQNELESDLYSDQDQMFGEENWDVNTSFSDDPKPPLTEGLSAEEASGVSSGLGTNEIVENIKEEGTDEPAGGRAGRAKSKIVENEDESNLESVAEEDKQKIDDILAEHTHQIDDILADFFESVAADDERVPREVSESYEGVPKMSSIREIKYQAAKGEVAEHVQDSNENLGSSSNDDSNRMKLNDVVQTTVELEMSFSSVERREEELHEDSEQPSFEAELSVSPSGRGEEMIQNSKQTNIEIVSPSGGGDEERSEESKHVDIKAKTPLSCVERDEKAMGEESNEPGFEVEVHLSPVRTEEEEASEDYTHVDIEAKTPLSCVERDEKGMGEESNEPGFEVEVHLSPVRTEEEEASEDSKHSDIEAKTPLSCVERDEKEMREESEQVNADVKLPHISVQIEDQTERNDSGYAGTEAKSPLSIIQTVKEIPQGNVSVVSVDALERNTDDVLKQTDTETKKSLSEIQSDEGTMEVFNQPQLKMETHVQSTQTAEIENEGSNQINTGVELPISSLQSREERTPNSPYETKKEKIGGEFKKVNVEMQMPPSPFQSEKEKIDEMLFDFLQTMASIDDNMKPTEQKGFRTVSSNLATAYNSSPEKTPVRSVVSIGDRDSDFYDRTPVHSPQRRGESRLRSPNQTPVRSTLQSDGDRSGNSSPHVSLSEKNVSDFGKSKTKSDFVLQSFKSLNESRSRITSQDLNQSVSDASETYLSTESRTVTARPHDPIASVLSRDSSDDDIMSGEGDSGDIRLEATGNEETLVINLDSPRPHDPIATVLSQDLSEDNSVRVEGESQDGRVSKNEPFDVDIDSPRPLDPGATVVCQNLSENNSVRLEGESQDSRESKNEPLGVDLDFRRPNSPIATELCQDLSENDPISQEEGQEENSDAHLDSPRPHNPVATVLSQDSSENDLIHLEEQIQDYQRGQEVNLDDHLDSPRPHNPVATVLSQDSSENDSVHLEEQSQDSKRGNEENLDVDPGSPRPHDPIATVLFQNPSSDEVHPKQGSSIDNSLDLDGKERTVVSDLDSSMPHDPIATVLSDDSSNREVDPIQDNSKGSVLDDGVTKKIIVGDTRSSRRHDPIATAISQDLSNSDIFRVRDESQFTRLDSRQNETALVADREFTIPANANSTMSSQHISATDVMRVTDNSQHIPLDRETTNEKLVSINSSVLQKAVRDKALTGGDSAAGFEGDTRYPIPRFDQDSVSEMTFSPISSPKARDPDSRPDLRMRMSYSCDSEDSVPGTKTQQSIQPPAESIAMPPTLRKTKQNMPEPSAAVPVRRRRSEPSKIPFHRTQARLSMGSPSRVRRERRSRVPNSPHKVESSRSVYSQRSSSAGSVVSWYTSPDRSRRSIASPLQPIRDDMNKTRAGTPPLRGGIRPPSPSTCSTTKDKEYLSPMRNENDANTTNSNSNRTPPPSPAVSLFSRMPHGAKSAIRKLNGIERNLEELLSGETIRVCRNKFVYNLHPRAGPCDRCWALASPEERDRYKARGSSLRIAKTRSGCDRTCAIFPPDDDEPSSVRLCRQCFFATHKQENSRLQVFRGRNHRVVPSRYSLGT